MKIQILWAGVLCAAGTLLYGLPADAAVTVLGNGLPANCYQVAEFGGDPAEGVKTCTQALENSVLSVSDRAATLVNRGILKSRCDDVAGAMADYEAGLRLNSKMGEAYVNRGATLISLHRFEDALKDISHGIALGSKRPEIAYYDRAIAREALGDIRGAYLDFKKAVAIQPEFEQASNQLKRFHVIRSGGQEGT